MAIGIVAGVLGSVVSAVGAMAGAQAQAQASRAQAEAYQRQALLERQQADFNAREQEHKAIKLISQQRSSYLSAGVSLYGTPMDVIDDSTKQSDLDVQAIRYNGEIKAQNFDMQARALNVKAQGQEQAGAIGAIAPLIKGIGGAAGGGGGFDFGGSTAVDDA
jgi:hypothetical protein